MAKQQPLTPRQQRAHYKVRAAVTDMEMGQPASARAKLEEALDLDHELVEARLWLGHVLVNEGEEPAALEQYEAGLVFAPGDPRLAEAIAAGEAAVFQAKAPEVRDLRKAKQRLVPNLILAALFPPSGIVLGLWEIVFGDTKEWKDLGLKTLLASLVALAGWVTLAFLLFVILGALEATVQ